jgi:YggT family protein
MPQSFWLLDLPQLVLAAIMYSLLGRFLLSLFFRPDSQAVLWRAYVTITDPFVKSARLITPRIIPDNLVILFAFVWALLARLGLFMAYIQFGGGKLGA